MFVRTNGGRRRFQTVSFDAPANRVRLIDQRCLPHEFKILATPDFQATAIAISNMTVRGAGAIGATAAYGLAQGARAFQGKDLKAFESHVTRVFNTLAEARPTAVDPVNALRQVHREMQGGRTIRQRQNLALKAARTFAREDVEHCRAIGRHGLSLIRDGMRILTHCNAGWLAFVDIGTATAPLYAAQAAGRRFHVFCDETRPRCQGASLTAWELAQQGVSHEILSDTAAGHLMSRGEVDLVITGSDRVLGRSGEVANKIGTYPLAVLARHHDIPFHVAIPLSTLDWEMARGLDIPIEERPQEEVLTAQGTDEKGRLRRVRVANPGSPARNPAFDVTPAELVTSIITPAGVFRPAHLWRHRRRLGGPVR